MSFKSVLQKIGEDFEKALPFSIVVSRSTDQ